MIECRTIKELCSVVVDCPHSTPTWTAEGKIVVRSNNIKNGRIDFSSPSYTDDEHFQQRIKRATPQGGDIIITREAPMGEVGMIPEGIVCCLGQRMVLLRANPEICDNYYLLYSLQSRYVQHQISWSEGTGTTVSNLRIPHLEQLKIPYLPLSKQRQVSSVLRCLEGKIEQNRVINDNLERQASAMVDQYFESVLSTVSFSDIMSFENGFAFQSSTYLPNGQYRIITIKNVQDGQIDTTGAAYIDELPQRMKSGCLLQVGDALLSLTGNVGRTGIVCENGLLLNQRVAKIVPHRKELLPLLYFIFRQPSMKTQLESIAKGTAQLNLSPVETLKLSVPYDVEVSLKLANALAPIYQAVIVNNQQSLILASIRDLLLPKLMSGELDVTDIQL